MKKKKWFLCAGLFSLLILSACTMPGVGSAASADSAPPVISNVTVSSQSVFYNESGCGPTTLTVSAAVSDDSGSVSTVGLQYRYHRPDNFGASLAWKDVSLRSAGNGRFVGDLNIAAEAGTVLGQQSGALQYQVYAVDNAGNVTTSPEKNARSISVQHCDGGVASAPSVSSAPAAPPAPIAPSDNDNGDASSGNPAGGYGGGSDGSSPTAEPTSADTFVGNPTVAPNEELYLNSVSASPSVIYYGQCNNNEPTSVMFYASIAPYENYAWGKLIFVMSDPASGSESGQFGGDLIYEGGDTFSFSSGSGISVGLENFLQGKDGYLQYWVDITSKYGVNTVSDVGYVEVHPCASATPTIPPVLIMPTIDYFTGPVDPVEPVTDYTLQWSVSNAACGIYLDGDLVSASGSKVMTAPFVVGSDTVTHTLEAYGEPCSNPFIESQNLTVTVNDNSPGATLMSGGTELSHGDSFDLDLAGGVDITFVYTSSGGQFYGVNGSLVTEWPYGTPNPGAQNCRLETGARGVTTLDVYDGGYICYITGNGNAGYLFITYLIPPSDANDPSSARINFTYETEIIP